MNYTLCRCPVIDSSVKRVVRGEVCWSGDALYKNHTSCCICRSDYRGGLLDMLTEDEAVD